jgi:predicted nucleotidyltransferase
MAYVDATKIDRIIQLAKNYGATRLILFGSAMETPQSARDIDIACDGVPGWKLYELAAKIEDELDIPLDIVPLTPSNRFTQNIEKRGKVLL